MTDPRPDESDALDVLHEAHDGVPDLAPHPLPRSSGWAEQSSGPESGGFLRWLVGGLALLLLIGVGPRQLAADFTAYTLLGLLLLGLAWAWHLIAPKTFRGQRNRKRAGATEAAPACVHPVKDEEKSAGALTRGLGELGCALSWLVAVAPIAVIVLVIYSFVHDTPSGGDPADGVVRNEAVSMEETERRSALLYADIVEYETIRGTNVPAPERARLLAKYNLTAAHLRVYLLNRGIWIDREWRRGEVKE